MSARELRVAVIGYSFMGRAHSNAWRNVGAFHPDLPAATHSYLERAAHSLREAITSTEVTLRYAHAHVAALRATFRRRGTEFPEQMVGLSERFVEDANARANWKAFASRNHPTDFQSLAQVVAELRLFLQEPVDHARTGKSFRKTWNPDGPWI